MAEKETDVTAVFAEYLAGLRRRNISFELLAKHTFELEHETNELSNAYNELAGIDFVPIIVKPIS